MDEQNRWLIDIDSTTMDTTLLQLQLANERFGSNFTIDHITAWQWEDYMPEEVCAYVWGDEVFKNLSFHAEAPTVRQSVETLRLMLDQGEILYFVSDRPDRLYETTRAWLDGHGLSEAKLVFTDRETWPKKLAAKQFGLEYVVEDAPHHSVDLANTSFIKQVYLLDYPYNRSVPDHPKITRVSGWGEIAARELKGELAVA